MTDHELLSMLLDDDLSEPEADDLRRRIGEEPELAVAWATMVELPDALAGLPELAPPPDLDALILGRVAATPESQTHARWGWIPLLAMAAALLIALMPRPTPELLLVEGHQRLSGELSVLAGDLVVEIDGTADVFVEPPGALLRERAAEDHTMTRQQLLAGLAGAIVTVVVYEGTATLHASEGDDITLGAGEQHRTSDRPTTPDAPETRPRTTRTGDTEDTADLQARIDDLNAKLEAARFHQAMAKGQLASHEGTPQAWPEDVHPSLQADGFNERLAAALEGHEDLSLLSVDCDEYPCFAIIESQDRTDDWGDGLDGVSESLKASYLDALGEDVGIHQSRSHYGHDDVDVRIEGLIIKTDAMQDDDLETRLGYRVDSAMEDLAEELLSEQTQQAAE